MKEAPKTGYKLTMSIRADFLRRRRMSCVR